MREPRVVHTANRDVTRRPINTFVVVGLSSYVCRDYAWRTVQSQTPTKSDVICGFRSINFSILHHVDFYVKQIFLVIIVTCCLNLPNILRTYCYQPIGFFSIFFGRVVRRNVESVVSAWPTLQFCIARKWVSTSSTYNIVKWCIAFFFIILQSF